MNTKTNLLNLLLLVSILLAALSSAVGQPAANFTRITTGAIANDGGSSIGPAWGDYDNDGWIDLFVANRERRKNFLYRNNGDGTFTKITAGQIVNEAPTASDSFGAAWGDFDNDGYLDLFVANGQAEPAAIAEDNFLYRNNGDGTFTKETSGDVVNDGGVSRSCAWGDYNNDGFLDLFVGNGGGPGSPDQSNFLYRNDGNSNHWINFQLAGRASNRSGIGAKVRLKATIGGKTFWQLREISGGGSCGQNDLRANFGLGDATNVDVVRVEWPSGTVQEVRNVLVNQFLTITEPPRLQTVGRQPDGSFQFQLTGGVGFRYVLETSSNLVEWAEWTAVTNATRTMLIGDSDATNAVRRFYRVHPTDPFSCPPGVPPSVCDHIRVRGGN